MVICTKCGFQNSDDSSFCASCGSFLEWTGEKVQPAAAPSPPPEPPAAAPEPERPTLIGQARRALGLEGATPAGGQGAGPGTGSPTAAPVAGGPGAPGTPVSAGAASTAPPPAAPAPVVVKTSRISTAAAFEKPKAEPPAVAAAPEGAAAEESAGPAGPAVAAGPAPAAGPTPTEAAAPAAPAPPAAPPPAAGIAASAIAPGAGAAAASLYATEVAAPTAPPATPPAAVLPAAVPPAVPPAAGPVEPPPVRPAPAQPAAALPPQSGTFAPGAFAPGTFAPGAFAPGAVAPGPSEPGPVQPEAVKPGTARPKAAPVPVAPAAPAPLPGELVCVVCGIGNEPTRRFCHRCGASLQRAAPAPTAKLPWWRALFTRPATAPRSAVTPAGARPVSVQREAAEATGGGRGLGRMLAMVVVAAIVVGAAGYVLVPGVRDAVGGAVNQIRMQVAPNFVPVHIAGAASGNSIAGHGPALAFDPFSNTAWEAPPGASQPSIAADFSPPANIAKVLITSGDPVNFQSQPRPRVIQLDFLDATKKSVFTKQFELLDSADFQTLDVNAPAAASFRLTVLTTYKSTSGTSVAIADVEFRARQ